MVETKYTNKIKQFLDKHNINYQKVAPSPFMKAGQADIQGTFENGKVFKIEVKRWDNKYHATLLQKYLLLKAKNNNEIVFLIDNEDKFNQFCDYIINKKYL